MRFITAGLLQELFIFTDVRRERELGAVGSLVITTSEPCKSTLDSFRGISTFQKRSNFRDVSTVSARHLMVYSRK